MKYNTFAKRLGQQLAQIRQDKSMTQVQLAREAGLSLKYVSMIESGTNPSVRTVFKVCSALETTLDKVMEEAEIGTVPRKPKKAQDVQVDVPADDKQVKKLIKFIKKLSEDDRRKALRLIKTTFGAK